MVANHLLLIEHFLAMSSFLLTIVFLSLLLRSRKSPASILAWLMLITAIPFVGIPLYLLLSSRKVTPRAPKKAILFSGATRFERTPESASRLERILIAAGGPPKRGNNEIEFLESGEQAYHSLIQMIEKARSTILIETFIFGRDPVARAIEAALAKKAQSGVQVYVLVDALGSSWMTHPSFNRLKAAGGKIAYFLPLFQLPFRGRSNLRNHRKMILIDGQEGMIGGMNLAREYLGPAPDPGRWVDLSVKIQGTGVQDLQSIFTSDWEFATSESIQLPETPSELKKQKTSTQLQIAAAGPDVPSDPIYDGLLSAIFEARSRIWIATPYFIPDDALSKALELAAKRGVDVKIVIPARSNHAIADLGRGSYIRQLHSAGAQIFFHPKMLHAKAILFDDQVVFTGSANMDLRSLLLNYEVGVFFYSPHETLHTSRWFEQLLMKSRTELKEAGFLRDIAEGVGRLFSPFL